MAFKLKVFNMNHIFCNDCHDLMQKAITVNDVAVVFVKRTDYRIHFWYMNKDNAINIMKNSNLKSELL